jgi:RecG-like helicase
MPGAGDAAPGRRLRQLADLAVTVLGGVGESAARDLAELDIATVFDLVTHYPRRHIDGTRMVTVDQLVEGEKAAVVSVPRRGAPAADDEGRREWSWTWSTGADG